jgi:hypothetical protein
MGAKRTRFGSAVVTIVVLCLSGFAKAENFGQWIILERDRSGLGLTWSGAFANSGSIGFICGKRPHTTLAILAPPPALYANARELVAVIVEPEGDEQNRITQDWSNGRKYAYQNNQADLEALYQFLRAQQLHGVGHVSFIFSGATDGAREKPEDVLAIRAPLDNFARAHDEWQRRCARLK